VLHLWRVAMEMHTGFNVTRDGCITVSTSPGRKNRGDYAGDGPIVRQFWPSTKHTLVQGVVDADYFVRMVTETEYQKHRAVVEDVSMNAVTDFNYSKQRTEPCRGPTSRAMYSECELCITQILMFALLALISVATGTTNDLLCTIKVGSSVDPGPWCSADSAGDGPMPNSYLDLAAVGPDADSGDESECEQSSSDERFIDDTSMVVDSASEQQYFLRQGDVSSARVELNEDQEREPEQESEQESENDITQTADEENAPAMFVQHVGGVTARAAPLNSTQAAGVDDHFTRESEHANFVENDNNTEIREAEHEEQLEGEPDGAVGASLPGLSSADINRTKVLDNVRRKRQTDPNFVEEELAKQREATVKKKQKRAIFGCQRQDFIEFNVAPIILCFSYILHEVFEIRIQLVDVHGLQLLLMLTQCCLVG
jgi:hypothetical protein